MSVLIVVVRVSVAFRSATHAPTGHAAGDYSATRSGSIRMPGPIVEDTDTFFR